MAFKFKLPGSRSGSTVDKDANIEKPLPLIGHLPFTEQLQILGGGVALSFLVGFMAVGIDYTDTQNGARYLELSSNFGMLTQRLAKDVAAASTASDPMAFEGIDKTREDFSTILAKLDKGENENLPATEGAPRVTLNALMARWKQTENALDEINRGRPILVTISRGTELNAEMMKMSSKLMGKATPGDAQKAERISLLLGQLIIGTVHTVMVSSSTEGLAQLEPKLHEARSLLNEMPLSDPSVAQLKDDLASYQSLVDFLTANADILHLSRQSGKVVLDDSEKMLKQSQDLLSQYSQTTHGQFTGLVMGLSALSLLAFMWLLFKAYVNEARHRAVLAEAANKQTQNAILRLMN